MTFFDLDKIIVAQIHLISKLNVAHDLQFSILVNNKFDFLSVKAIKSHAIYFKLKTCFTIHRFFLCAIIEFITLNMSHVQLFLCPFFFYHHSNRRVAWDSGFSNRTKSMNVITVAKVTANLTPKHQFQCKLAPFSVIHPKHPF